MTRNTMRPFAVALLASLAVAACTSDDGSADDDRVTAFERAVDLEHGVPVIVADLSEIAPGVEPEITRTPDTELGVWRMLGRSDQPGVPLINMEIQPPADDAAVEADRTLDDGRSVEIEDAATSSRVSWVTADDRLVLSLSLELGMDELIDVIDAMEIDGDEVTALPAGWEVMGTVPIPGYLDGFTAYYELAPDAVEAVWIRVERRRGDRMLLAAFGPSEAVDLGLDGEARRWIPERGALPGYIFEYGDDLIVEVTGDLTHEAFLQVIDSLREAEPGEFEILEPSVEF